MKITVNGESVDLEPQISVAELLIELDYGQPDPNGLALAINQSITPQAEWMTTLLEEGDEVVIFRAIAGG